MRGARYGQLAAFLLLILALGLSVQAQADGQFCVRAYDDNNGNGTRDGGEALLRDGISAELSDESGVVIASALLVNSPTAAQGVICFTGLAPSQYTISVSSADYAATSPATMTLSLQAGDLPAVLEYGARSLASAQAQDLLAVAPEPTLEDNLPRILWASLAAIGAALVMMVLGLLVWLIFFRRARAQVLEEVTDTAQYQRPRDTGNYPPAP